MSYGDFRRVAYRTAPLRSPENRVWGLLCLVVLIGIFAGVSWLAIDTVMPHGWHY
jgi:hypothetical protein